MAFQRVAVVILNWNGKSFLEKFLPSVIASKPQWANIVIADNASTDGSVSFLRSKYPELELVLLKENLGYAGGYNAALKFIEASYYVLLNSDIEVGQGWIEPVIEYLEAHSEVAAAQPKILSWNQPSMFEYAGASGGFIDLLAYPFCRGRIFQTLETDFGQYNNPVNVFWATGACLFVRAKAFWEAGGFDERFFAHMEEIDLCWRLQNLGFKIAVVPHSKVFHVGGGTLPKSSPFKTFLNFRNSLWLLAKNMPARYFLILLPLRLFLDTLAALVFLAGGNKGDALAVFKAHLAFQKSFGYLCKQSKGVSKKIHPGMYKGSIVFAHFLMQKKYFSDLIFGRRSEKQKN